MTAPNGAIVFNSSTGNDTTASGLGSANVYGSGASTTGSSAVVTGIDTTGVSSGDLLWVQSSSGRQFSIIFTVDSSTQVTCDDVFANTESGRTWAIGGKRATWDNADSRQCFADSAGWVFETETDQSLTSSISCPNISGTHEFKGSSGGIKTITQTADDSNFGGGSNVGSIMIFRNLKLQNSNASKTAANGLAMKRIYHCFDCVFGDPVNQLLRASVRAGDFPQGIINNCIIQNCTATNPYSPEGGWMVNNGRGFVFNNCIFRNNAESGLVTYQYNVTCIGCIFHNNVDHGWVRSIGATREGVVSGCIFVNNGGDGMHAYSSSDFGDTSVVRDNIYAGNGGYGLDVNAPFPSYITRGNAFYNNTSGSYSDSRIASDTDITLTSDPFVDAANGNFQIDSNAGGGATLRANNFALNTGTSVYPFRQYVSDDFDSGAGGGGATVHPLYAN